MTLQKLTNGIFVDTSKIDKIKTLDAIIFDCDGVLIDITNSYDLAIKKTVDFILKEMANIVQSNIVTTQMIEGFKATGGFNDEVDVTYSLILSIVAAKKLNKSIVEFIFEVIKNCDQSGICSVEKYLDMIRVDLSEIRKKLAYPGSHDSKIAIISGRGVISAKYSLKKLFDEFDLKNSRFLEDETRDLAKPNPQPLISSIKGLQSYCCMFVGDSMEDYIMAKKSEELGNKTVFCGIYGTSKDSEE